VPNNDSYDSAECQDIAELKADYPDWHAHNYHRIIGISS